jgi:hypothetical protein
MKQITLKHIIIGEKSKPLKYIQTAKLETNKGIVGDRYYYGKGTFNKPQLDQSVREISILDANTLDICNQRLNTNLTYLDLRRNLIIENFDIELLENKIFTIGNTKLKIVRTAPPCRYLSRLLSCDMMNGLKYIGGYRATIIQSGTISVGDTINLN